MFESNDRAKICKAEVDALSKFLTTKYPGWKFEICTKAGIGGDKDGICEYGRKTIGMTRYALADVSVNGVVAVFIHELAHIETPGDEHGKLWKEKNEELLKRYSKEVFQLVKVARQPFIEYFRSWGAHKELM